MTTTSEAILAARLALIVGPNHLLAAPSLTVEGLRPAFSVSPGTLEEAAQILQVAAEVGAAVTPWGGGTQQRIGAPPGRLDIVLRTERLNAIVEWEPADLTACLQAGMTLGTVQAALAERGQQIPIDAPLASRATLGGLVATNSAGPRRWLSGGWRDQIIGMHMALPNGSLIKSGGRVVKNVQGYDLGKLFTGSLGTLGLIGQVNVKLVPLPAVRRLLVVRGDLHPVADLIEHVAASTLRLSTLDLLDSVAAQGCGLSGGGYAALLLVEGGRTLVDAQSLRVEQMARADGLSCLAVDEEALAPIWQTWLDLGRTDDLSPCEALFTVSTLPAEVAEVLHAFTLETATHELEGRCWARAGNGLVYARLTARTGSAANALAAAQLALLERWPSTTLVAGDPAVERAARPWGNDPESLPVMRALKQRFDPAGILQPGRYIGGI
ncbi:MAG: FAD-binding oxidoreductase [Dehalococcoidia bacterium]